MREFDHIVNGTTTHGGLLGSFQTLPPTRRHLYVYLCLILSTIAGHQFKSNPSPEPTQRIITYNP